MVDGTQRKLAAIVLIDVVGYSRLMGANEIGTLATMKAHRAELWDPTIEQFGGRVVNGAGDSMLVEFKSAVAALEGAVTIQMGMVARNTGVPDDKRMQLRIGVNLGEVIVDGAEIFGDGVNVAARLETLAAPSGICISGNVHEQIRDRLDLLFEDLGEKKVKNISRPVQVWQWMPPAQATDNPVATDDALLPLPDKPSIAVLAFDNMSGDREQEFFADGISEDVITALSRFSSLFVIARNSSFTYKGQAVDIGQVGRELGVRYVVEGSVRKGGNRVRITAQLIDAVSGNHVWADRFDGALDDVFDLQDQITEKIVVAIEPEIGARERERVRRKPPGTLDGWEFVQRGLSHFYRFNDADNNKAISLFRKAIELDPESAAAHAHLSDALRAMRTTVGYAGETVEIAALAREAAEKAVALDPNDPSARVSLGRNRVYDREVEMAIVDMQAAIDSNPNSARGHYGFGWALFYGSGRMEEALSHLETALRLSSRDPLRWLTLMVKGAVLRDLGRYDEAIETSRQACQYPDSGFLPQVILAASLADADRLSDARAVIDKLMQIQPTLSINFLRNRFVGMHESTLESQLKSLREAGLPE